jgi:acetyltransferase
MKRAVATCVLFSEVAFDLFLKDGTPVLLRSMRDEDARLIGIFHSQLSDRTVYQRYFQSVKLVSRANEDEVRQYCRADLRVQCKLVALRLSVGKNEIIAIAEIPLTSTAPRTMEWGLVIADQFQGSGLGKQMCDRLLLVSRQAGAKRIRCFSLFENIAVMRLARRLGFALQYAGGGLIEGELLL